MDKYTLKTAFQKSFLGIVWRLEVDIAHELMAVETRDVSSGTPRFSSFRYTTGTTSMQELPYGDRNWTLAGIVDSTLILRAYGQHSPESAGIAGIDAMTGNVLWEQFNYTLLALEGKTLLARHRNFASGYAERLRISDGTPIRPSDQEQNGNNVIPAPGPVIPSPYAGDRPQFLRDYTIHGELFHCTVGQYGIWGFHEKENQTYHIRLVISNDSGVQTDKIAITGLEKMIPELFFMIGNQIFLIGDNKQKIVSYLV